MRAAVHVVPCAGVLRAAGEVSARRSGMGGSGLVHAALAAVDRLDAPADLVLVAVPAGRGQELADRIVPPPAVA
jgi:prephenate dehydrogenase